MVTQAKGCGKGNWGSRGGDRRKEYDTIFDSLLGKLLSNYDRRPKEYPLHLRGIMAVLGLDAETFHRFRNGTTRPEPVVYAHMNALLRYDYEKLPDLCYWRYRKHFSIAPVARKMEDTDEIEEVYEITLDGVQFHARKFPIYQNRKFRQLLYEQLGLITPPVDRNPWKKIVDKALTGVYRGPGLQR